MPNVTLEDCARCPVLRICSAHISNGAWQYDSGIDPCRVDIGNDSTMIRGGCLNDIKP